MKHVFSMSSTLIALLRGERTLAEIDGPDVEFHFACRRSHVLSTDRVPLEGTWQNKTKPLANNPTEVLLSAVDDEHQDTVRQFVELVRRADADNRVEWKQHMGERIKSLPPDAVCLWGGQWRTAAEGQS